MVGVYEGITNGSSGRETAAPLALIVEECAELIHALNKYRRGRIDVFDVVLELADVSIMLGQMELIFGKAQIGLAKRKKLCRLRERLG